MQCLASIYNYKQMENYIFFSCVLKWTNGYQLRHLTSCEQTFCVKIKSSVFVRMCWRCFPQTPTSWTTRRCQTWRSWWRENLFTATECCSSQLLTSQWHSVRVENMFTCDSLTLIFVFTRFKSLLASSGPDGTCNKQVEIFDVKYNIFQVKFF